MRRLFVIKITLALCFFLCVFLSVDAQNITITQPVPGSQFVLPATITLTAQPEGVVYPEPTCLLVSNTLGGYRKLKLGYSPVSLYTPVQNVISGGNTQMEIRMKWINGNVDWSKILIKPNGSGSLTLQPYIPAAGGLGNEWKVITIPLSDFSSTINFTQIANIEFPYSANAALFSMAVASIRFTGGSSPFTWFGEGKTDNKHNGNNGSGELLATLIESVAPESYPVKVEFKSNNLSIGQDLYPPFSTDWIPAEPGSYTLTATMFMSDDQLISSPPVSIGVTEPAPPAFSVALAMPGAEDTLDAPATIGLQASVTGLEPGQPACLLVTNTMTGYRKLKLGNNPNSLYSPLVNVVQDGNTMMEITLRDAGNGVNWSKIQVRPAGIGSLSILPYINAAGGVGSGWKTINIPLSAFSSSINFSALANIEFPFSADAGNFQIAVQSVRFTGGENPYVWFGFGKTDNKHNGNGGSGELVASLIPGNSTVDFIEKVEFYEGDAKLGEDPDSPYTWTRTGLLPGSYTFRAKAISHLGETAISPPSHAVVIPPYQPTLSVMTVNITYPSSGGTWLTPLRVPINLRIEGAIAPGANYLHVINTMSGYVKLKMGYAPNSIYSPKQNVISGGNDTLELIIRNPGVPIDWSKIRLRPAGAGSLSLASYVTAAGGINGEWTTLHIPLSDFDPSIDFSALGFFEFPYSASAGAFELDIRQIRFTGGTSPFTWFGDGKTNNAHDGDGASGHMAAQVVSPAISAVDAAKAQLFDNGNLISEDVQPPFTPEWVNPVPGTHHLWVKMTDTRNAVAWSDTVTVTAVTEAPAGFHITQVEFDHPPTRVFVEKAPLRYDKDFAYSFSLDDGLTDAYTCAFRLLNGGFSPVTGETYPGLFYSDGCGNQIPFKANLVWYSVNSAYSDIHVNTPGYVRWSQLNEMLGAGWSVMNHSFSHATAPGTNYMSEIMANDSAVFSRTGFRMKHFVAPSDDAGYLPAAWQCGISCAYSRTASPGAPYGLRVDQPLSYDHCILYRDFKSDELVTPLTISYDIDQCAGLSNGGNHYWYHDFTHHVSPDPYGGSLLFPTFRSYMEQIAATYGLNGSDRIWMAPATEVFDYLRRRDFTPATWSWNGTQLRIMVDRNNLPVDLQHDAMSFRVDADATITNVQPASAGSVHATFRGNTPRKLINLEWDQPVPGNPSSITGKQSLFKEQPVPDHAGILLRQVNRTLTLSLPDKAIRGIIKIYDAWGVSVMNVTLPEPSADGLYRFSLDGLSTGFYIALFSGVDGIRATGRIIIYPQ